MADLPHTVHITLVVLGTIGCAVGTRTDMTSLWAFLLPCVSGASIMFVSWVSAVRFFSHYSCNSVTLKWRRNGEKSQNIRGLRENHKNTLQVELSVYTFFSWRTHFERNIFLQIVHCATNRSFYPRGKYWLFHFLPGILLAAAGMTMYAGLQTENNYGYVHSVWHICIAAAALCLLPNKKTEGTEEGVASTEDGREHDTDGEFILWNYFSRFISSVWFGQILPLYQSGGRGCLIICILCVRGLMLCCTKVAV